MKIKEIKEKDTEALKHELLEKQKELFKFQTKTMVDKEDDTTLRGKTKKDIARIKTVLRQRELEASAKK